jgi:hypothetical protein
MENTKSMVEVYGASGYPMKKVIASVLLATVLHVVVLGAYFILGSSKKPPATPSVEPEKNAAAAPQKDGKSPDKAATKTAPGDEKKPDRVSEENKKGAEVAKPGEIPSKPDTDIDDILKRK